jgi:anti-sigma factor RsiW
MFDEIKNKPIESNGHVQDLLPAYIDRSLEENERVRVRAHLEECTGCRADYVELQATRRMLQQMPIVAVPRAFTLTPEMVKGAARKTSLWERIFSPRSVPTFASGSVMAFALLLFLFATTAFTQPSSAPVDSYATSMLMTQAPERPAGGSEESTSRMSEEPTPVVAADGAPNESSAKQPSAEPSAEPPVSAGANPAPDATPLPGGMGGGNLPESSITPNTTVGESGTGSPTTTSLYFTPTEGEDTANSAGGSTDTDSVGGGEGADSMTDVTTAQSPLAQTFDLLLAIEIALLVIGVGLGVAALIARRRAA